MSEALRQTPKSRIRTDLTAVLLMAVPALLLAVRFDGFERLFEWSRAYETYAVDELITLCALMTICLAVFIVRRLRDLRREVAHRQDAERRLEHETLHDQLTRLPNRRLLAELGAQALRAARRSGQSVGLLLVNLDRFKEINDTLGHRTGDALLRQIGPRLSAELREVDTVARLGGDEFAVLLPEIADQPAAERVAVRLLDALRRAFDVEGLSLALEASVGVAVQPDHADSIEGLLRCADVAMYHAKQAHAGLAVYDAEADRHTPARLTLLAELREALERRELVLHFQPVAELDSGRVRRVEALVRWQHPRHGLLYPDSFIPAAEQTGLIKPLSLYVIDAALRQCRAWRDDGWDVSVAVNLSARNLLDLELPADVTRLLRTWGLPPDALELELTETTVMVDPGRSLRVLGGLAEMGVRLAIDDYGTGYSSLAYLRRLPVHELKIDKSFVLTMSREQGNEVIVRSTIDLARHFGLRVVAEGVEDQATLRLLAALGCDAAQGYYLSPPVPAAEVSAVVRHLESAATARV
jgi:diguanylate cyclase (GGDEF)-like protein